MNVARVTVMAMAQGLARGRHVSWKEGVAAAANRSNPFRRNGCAPVPACRGLGSRSSTEYRMGVLSTAGQALCHAEDKMTEGTVGAKIGARLVLGIDTCGPSGSVALARLSDTGVELLEQIELAGKTYSATLVTAVGALLTQAQARVGWLQAMAVTSGPGSFTGVRVGLSAVKGLAEPGGIPVVAVSRLAVLARKARVDAAALDAHRHEVFVRAPYEGAKVREVLAGMAELEAFAVVPERVAVCDDAAAELLKAAWHGVELAAVKAPDASDAIELAVENIRAREFADLALLDGHYLRRSDAEIFGESAQAVARRA